MSINTQKNNLIALFEKELSVPVHLSAGRFNIDEIKTKSFRAPAVFLSVLSSKISQSYGFDVHFAAFIVSLPKTFAKDKTGQSITIAEKLLILLNGKRNLQAKDLYTGNANKLNVSIWAVEWREHIDINTADAYNALDDFNHFHSEYSNAVTDDLNLGETDNEN